MPCGAYFAVISAARRPLAPGYHTATVRIGPAEVNWPRLKSLSSSRLHKCAAFAQVHDVVEDRRELALGRPVRLYLEIAPYVRVVALEPLWLPGQRHSPVSLDPFGFQPGQDLQRGPPDDVGTLEPVIASNAGFTSTNR